MDEPDCVPATNGFRSKRVLQMTVKLDFRQPEVSVTVLPEFKKGFGYYLQSC